jgi:antitoxin ParD1/3/4
MEITPELEAMVRDLFLSGNYSGEHEILHEALVLLSNRDRLRLEIRQGLEELDRGEGVDAEDAFRVLHASRAYLGLVD